MSHRSKHKLAAARYSDQGRELYQLGHSFATDLRVAQQNGVLPTNGLVRVTAPQRPWAKSNEGLKKNLRLPPDGSWR